MPANVVFIIGWNANEAGYKGLMEYIAKWYAAKLPAGTKLLVSRWDRDVAAEIKAKFPTGDLVLIGFSFGGQKAIEVAAAFPKVKKLILIDPVDYHFAGKPCSGFVVPDSVASAHCFYRLATAVPWSGPIRSARCEFYNKKYNPVKPINSGEAHGEYVWAAETIAVIKANL